MSISQPRRSLFTILWILFLSTANPLSANYTPWRTQLEGEEPQVHLYFFWSPTCPHCKKARLFIEPLPEQYPWIQLHSASIIGSRENAVRYYEMAKAVGQKASSVPGFFICGEMFTGWDSVEGMGQVLMQALEKCKAGHTPQKDKPAQQSSE